MNPKLHPPYIIFQNIHLTFGGFPVAQTAKYIVLLFRPKMNLNMNMNRNLDKIRENVHEHEQENDKEHWYEHEYGHEQEHQ